MYASTCQLNARNKTIKERILSKTEINSNSILANCHRFDKEMFYFNFKNNFLYTCTYIHVPCMYINKFAKVTAWIRIYCTPQRQQRAAKNIYMCVKRK